MRRRPLQIKKKPFRLQRRTSTKATWNPKLLARLPSRSSTLRCSSIMIESRQAAVQAMVVIEDFASGDVAKLFPGLKVGDTPIDPRRAQKGSKKVAE